MSKLSEILFDSGGNARKSGSICKAIVPSPRTTKFSKNEIKEGIHVMTKSKHSPVTWPKCNLVIAHVQRSISSFEKRFALLHACTKFVLHFSSIQVLRQLAYFEAIFVAQYWNCVLLSYMSVRVSLHHMGIWNNNKQENAIISTSSTPLKENPTSHYGLISHSRHSWVLVISEACFEMLD